MKMQRTREHRLEHRTEQQYRVPGAVGERLRRTIVSEVLLLFLVLFLPGMLMVEDSVEIELFDHLGFHLSYGIVAIPQILLILHVIKSRPEIWAREFGIRRLRLPDALWAALLIPVLFGALAVVLGLAFALQQIGVDISMPHGAGFRLTRPELLPLVAITSLLTGYREELFFRAYMLPRLGQAGVRVPHAVAVSTTLFAVGHIYQGAVGLLFAAVIGVVLSFAFYRRRSVHHIGLAHAAYNFLSLVFTLAAEANLG